MIIKKLTIATTLLSALAVNAIAAPTATQPTNSAQEYARAAQEYEPTPAANPWPAKTFYIEGTIGRNLAYSPFGRLFGMKEYKTGGSGWSGAVGYSFNSFFGLELGFMQNYGFYGPAKEDSDISVRAHTNIPYFTTRVTIPVGKVAFIGKLGLMSLGVDGTLKENGQTYHIQTPPEFTIPFSGIGIGYSITPHIQILAQYQGAFYAIAGFGLASLGLNYRF